MWRLLVLALCLLPLAAAAQERPQTGLMWNRSGLPATFPLQVKTLPGKDYLVHVTEPGSGRAVMAGYIRGGDFFRLLVPPGQWRLRFAYGLDWQGKDALFGPETGRTEMRQVLDFSILGLNRRRVYIVTLIEENGTMTIVDADPRAECQIVSWTSEDAEYPPERGLDPVMRERRYGIPRPNGLEAPPKLRYIERSFVIRKRLCG
ncbi:MAG: hypothetical protein ABGW82_09330 [Paracoccus sp. (in: a-proteobacteria)]